MSAVNATIDTTTDADSEWVSSEARSLTGEPIQFANGYSWEMDEVGNHRIVDDQGRGGDWACYNSIAASPDASHIVVSRYFEGLIPTEHLLEIRMVDRAAG